MRQVMSQVRVVGGSHVVILHTVTVSTEAGCADGGGGRPADVGGAVGVVEAHLQSLAVLNRGGGEAVPVVVDHSDRN